MTEPVYGNYHRDTPIGAECLLGTARDLATAHEDAARGAWYGDSVVHELEQTGPWHGRIVRVVHTYPKRSR